jgi:hypothetical protein
MDNADDTEGYGMGIALIVILLKSEKLDPNLFTIVTAPDTTTARIKIPITIPAAARNRKRKSRDSVA